MHKEILTKEQIDLLPLVKQFKRKYYLVGGTAIALHIGHRFSIDFDLFTFTTIDKKDIKNKFGKFPEFRKIVIWENAEQIHFSISDVKFTFYQYPYKITARENFNEIVKLPSLLDLASMKAIALGGRAKWKDYVDLYFILKTHFSAKQISEKANDLFGEENFSAKLFKEQLSFFDDIDYNEPVTYIKGFEVTEAEVKSFLTNVATEPF